jgi:hypothetical protein
MAEERKLRLRRGAAPGVWEPAVHSAGAVQGAAEHRPAGQKGQLHP